MQKLAANKQLNFLLKSFCLGEDKVNLDDSVASWAQYVGLGAIAYDYGIINSSFITDDLKAQNLTTQFWFGMQLQSIKNIVKSLNDSNIVPCLLKGISTSTAIYAKPHYRGMRDLDILINVNEIEEAERIIAALGYEQRSTFPSEFYQSHHHTMPWQNIESEVWLEVHKQLFPISSPISKTSIFNIDAIRRELKREEFYGMQVYRINYELQIIYIAIHWAENYKQVGAMFGLLDIALIINKHRDDLDWLKIVSWANDKQVSNFVYTALSFITENHYVNKDYSGHVNKINHTMGCGVKRIINSLIKGYFLEGKAYGRVMTLSNIEIIWTHLLAPRMSCLKLLLMPIYIVFPKKADNRFQFAFLFSRLLTLVGFKKNNN